MLFVKTELSVDAALYSMITKIHKNLALLFGIFELQTGNILVWCVCLLGSADKYDSF